MRASQVVQGFPCSLVSEESACNAGNPGSVPGLGGFPGEGLSYPLQCSWASLEAQMVKNPAYNAGHLSLILQLKRCPSIMFKIL